MPEFAVSLKTGRDRAFAEYAGQSSDESLFSFVRGFSVENSGRL